MLQYVSTMVGNMFQPYFPQTRFTISFEWKYEVISVYDIKFLSDF